MNIYYITAIISQPVLSHNRMQLSESAQSWLISAPDADDAQKQFEILLSPPREDKMPSPLEITRIVVAPLFEQLLTEIETIKIDWQQIAEQLQADMESTPDDDFEQGFWVDVNAVVHPSKDIKALRQDLPEDISSTLNWSENKQFFFLLSVLTLLRQSFEPDGGVPAEQSTVEDSDEGAIGPDELADFPQLLNKEGAILIRARNSAVAAWLWRKHAAGTRLANKLIRIDPLCNGPFGETIDEP